jgi:hypothetical protein
MQLINTRNDVGVCDELAARLTELRDAWRAIAEGGGGPSPSAPALRAASGAQSAPLTA